jgi:hypothetical protein
MDPTLVGLGIVALASGVGGTLKVGIGSLVVGGTLGGVLIVLGTLI